MHLPINIKYLFPFVLLFALLGKSGEHFHKRDKVAVYDNWNSSSENCFCQNLN